MQLLLNPAVGTVSMRCPLPPWPQEPLIDLGSPRALRGAVSVPWPRWCRPCPIIALCHPRVPAWELGSFQGLLGDYSLPELHGKLSVEIDFSVNLFWPQSRREATGCRWGCPAGHQMRRAGGAAANDVGAWTGSAPKQGHLMP